MRHAVFWGAVVVLIVRILWESFIGIRWTLHGIRRVQTYLKTRRDNTTKNPTTRADVPSRRPLLAETLDPDKFEEFLNGV